MAHPCESEGGPEAVIVVGHGRPASDTPRALLARLRALEHGRRGGEATAEERGLDEEIRRWPRTPETDPYREGLDAIRAALAAALGGGRVAMAFNEFCAPSLEEAVAALVGEGHERIAVVTTMITPGGNHSERDIPEVLERLRGVYPGVRLRYVWPFPVGEIARFLATSLREPPTGGAR